MKTTSLVLCLLLIMNGLAAQLCEGNLGENIFAAGDFGTGAPNLIATDPGIAPGYIYTTNVPPEDGFYTITNSTGEWPGLYPSWLAIPDNSNDPDGYMMVVNASFSPGLFYEEEVDGLCENTLYVFSADIINLIRTGTANHSDPNISFLINDVEQFTTGNIPKTNNWATYGFTFTTEPGQTSVTLSLRNNAPGGIGNDVALDNITFRPCGPLAQILPQTIERICEDGENTELVATVDGDQYPTPAFQWQRSLDEGMTWTDIPGENDSTYLHTDLSAGFYYYRYLLANGPENLASSRCRVNSNIKIVEVVPKLWTVTDTICEGLTYFSGSSAYMESGIYEDSLISAIGCDSIVTLNLTVVPDPGIVAEVAISQPPCIGDLGGLTISNVQNGFPDYLYQLDDSLAGPVNSFSSLPEGVYELRVTDRFGCSFETSANISPAAPFTIELGPDQTILLGEEVRFNVNATDEVVDYVWTPLPADCAPDCHLNSFAPFESATYQLVATSDNGCVAEDAVTIDVRVIRQVYFPNAFSPNLDGVNDFFAPFVISPNVQQVQSFRVFNRWGGLVHEQTNFFPNGTTDGWDGNHRDRPAQNGVYTYQADIEFLDGTVINYSGTVTLVR
ncbi:MAG: gliding motility-associated C-terminal domain-containing protein [Bacteroidota bacterium]